MELFLVSTDRHNIPMLAKMLIMCLYRKFAELNDEGSVSFEERRRYETGIEETANEQEHCWLWACPGDIQWQARR